MCVRIRRYCIRIPYRSSMSLNVSYRPARNKAPVDSPYSKAQNSYRRELLEAQYHAVGLDHGASVLA